MWSPFPKWKQMDFSAELQQCVHTVKYQQDVEQESENHFEKIRVRVVVLQTDQCLWILSLLLCSKSVSCLESIRLVSSDQQKMHK
jgi:hypothetical protein